MTLGNASLLDDIDLVVFDLFGTLVEIGSRRRPLAHLRRRMSPEKSNRFRQLAMTTDMTLSEIDAELQGGATVADLVVAQTAIAHEVASVRIRPGVQEMLAGLPVRYGLCSNLSPDYVPALARFPEIQLVFQILSCQVGSMKPDPAIYAHIIEAAGVPPDRILFTGDTPAADIDGPIRSGMRAVHIDDLIAALTGGGAAPDRPDTFTSTFRAARDSVSKER